MTGLEVAMQHARLRLIEQALYEQHYRAVLDFNKRGRHKNRLKGLRKLFKLANAAWLAAQGTMPHGYEGPIERGVDPDPR